MPPLLQVKNLSVTIKRHDTVLKLIEGVSFDVHAGETLGIVGESGSGKSTTGLALLQLNSRSSRAHTTGEILFDGDDVLRMDDVQLRKMRGRDISMVLQDPMASLNPAFTIGQQIEEALTVHKRCAPHERRERAIEALRRVRIANPEKRIDDYPHQMSGGMKQRVVGAIALACEPRLLIADEPTTSLDVTVQAQYLDLLKDLQRESGMAMVFVTHDFGVVAKMCDRVCVLYAGQIVETASVSAIFHRPAHWYTQALLNSIPKLHSKAERLISIAGSPPTVEQRPTGCRFAPRCPQAKEKCVAETPTAQAIDAEHSVLCWYPKV
jgi:oligopeptide/dipeptide ABC transporter ATP-binding protein